jgi:putative membrane protein
LENPKARNGLGQPVWKLDSRVQPAAERTLFAWVRTGLALIGFGFIVARFGLVLQELAALGDQVVPSGHKASLVIGTAMVALGVWVLAAAGLRHRRDVAHLTAGHELQATAPAFGLTLAVLLAIIGVVMAVYLLSMA